MDNRREFIKKAALLAGAAGFSGLPESIKRALEINPAAGTTFLDAEHIVFLMQENRSFDHCYGALQGVRGFNDPRAISLPNKNKVWLQTNAKGETYAPFRLDLKNTKATWMRSLPHSWTNQVDARNDGKYDKWLDTKQSGNEEYKEMPLTMGFYNREDIPFYYALADAFTVCDQNFCSALTGTTPNRLYFWSGTIRAEQNERSKANVWNDDADYDDPVNWKTYPERLEENNVSWKVYQNDISVSGGFSDEEDSWMSNFTDNPLEFFSQYHVKLSPRYIYFLQKQLELLPSEIRQLEEKLSGGTLKETEKEALTKQIESKKKDLQMIREEAGIYTQAKFDALPDAEKKIHEKAFIDNRKDPLFYKLTKFNYTSDNVKHEVTVPAGDIFFQFRKDVNEGTLPAVSWVVAPENFSDHPSSAWYGAWYISEMLDILTKNPEVWKKTIFIINYDENDGYFDHVPPFVAPHPNKPETGKNSPGIDSGSEYVTRNEEQSKKASDVTYFRESPIGLGYRVPMVIVSPWTRGGWVNSQVFDHTSCLQFLEKFLEKKTGKRIQETNISTWRRAICGDLTSVFRPYAGEKITFPEPIEKNPFFQGIHEAKFKKIPSAYQRLSQKQIEQVNRRNLSDLMPMQEKGTRSSCALPYELYVDGRLTSEKKTFQIQFEAGNKLFGEKAAGSPFTVYSFGKTPGDVKIRSYAVAAGEKVLDEWSANDGVYHLQVHGPNGFYREFIGATNDPVLNLKCAYAGEQIELRFQDKTPAQLNLLQITDNYSKRKMTSANGILSIDTKKTFGWYDFSIQMKGRNLLIRYAGKIENGEPGQTDPAMGFPGT